MFIDSFDFKQRNLISELMDKHVIITEVSDIEEYNDVGIRLHFKNAYDKEKFMHDFELIVDEYKGMTDD